MSTGTETLRRSYDARRRAASQVIHASKPIPGYTGHLRGHAAENVFAATFGEAMVVAHEAKDRRADTLPGDPVLTNSQRRSRNFDNGSLNTTMGSKLSHEPIAKAVSTFHNPRGHNFRAGASVPGYAGYIPGKVPGNCFGKRYAMDNLHATETRRINDEGAEWRTNWILASETNKNRLAHGAHALGNHFQFSKDHPVRDASATAKSWKLWEPQATHEKLRY